MKEPQLLIEALYSYGGDREDRLTEVFKTVLEVNHELSRAVTRRLGLRSEPKRYSVETQFGPPGQRRLVDMVLRGVDAAGDTVATVFMEHKYNPTSRLEAYWFDEDQATRQRRALNDQPGERLLGAIASKSDLDRLDGPPEARPPFDPRPFYDAVISWSDVRAMAEKLGRSPAGDEAAPHGDTSVADRLVLEFLAYLELEGDAMGALGNDDVFALGRVGLAQDRVDRLIYRATEMLAGAIGPTEGDQEFAFEPAEENGVDEGCYYSAPAREGTWLYGLREAEIYVMEASDESDEDDATTTPTVWAGVTWYTGLEGKSRIAGSKWEARVHEASFEVDWDKYTVSVSALRPLSEIADAGGTIAQQAKTLADWANSTVRAILNLPPPPHADGAEGSDDSA